MIKSERLAEHLAGCDKATLMAVTIGKGIEKETNDVLRDLLRDAIGTEAVEALADKVNDIVKKNAKQKGYKTKWRFSVGYGDWNIEDQKHILEALKADFVTLSESFMMSPKKSVTAIIGWNK